MGFSLNTVTLAWQRAGERCECSRPGHAWHQEGARCNRSLSLRDRRREENPGAWAVEPKVPAGGDDLENCEVVCWQCHLARQRSEE